MKHYASLRPKFLQCHSNGLPLGLNLLLCYQNFLLYHQNHCIELLYHRKTRSCASGLHTTTVGQEFVLLDCIRPAQCKWTQSGHCLGLPACYGCANQCILSKQYAGFNFMLILFLKYFQKVIENSFKII